MEAIATRTNNAKVVIKFLKKNIFTRFGMPIALLSDGGTHFYKKLLEALLKKYGVFHKVATPYHPQTSGKRRALRWWIDLARLVHEVR